MSHASSGKCNMTLLQQPGQKKLLILKPKIHRRNAANFFIQTFYQRKWPKFLVARDFS